MTAYLAGIVQARCVDHPKASDIDGVMRAVLAAMTYPVRDGRSRCPDSERYLCTESVAKIAERCGFGRKAVMGAQERAADLGLIECVRVEPKKPRHWRIKIVMNDDNMSLTGTRQTSSSTVGMSPRGTKHVPERDKTCPLEGHYPEKSFGALAEKDFDSGADAPAGASASASAAPAIKASAKTIALIATLDGCSVEHTERWAEHVLSRAEIRRAPGAYLIKCQKNGNGPASWTPPPPRSPEPIEVDTTPPAAAAASWSANSARVPGAPRPRITWTMPASSRERTKS